MALTINCLTIGLHLKFSTYPQHLPLLFHTTDYVLKCWITLHNVGLFKTLSNLSLKAWKPKSRNLFSSLSSSSAYGIKIPLECRTAAHTQAPSASYLSSGLAYRICNYFNLWHRPLINFLAFSHLARVVVKTVTLMIPPFQDGGWISVSIQINSLRLIYLCCEIISYSIKTYLNRGLSMQICPLWFILPIRIIVNISKYFFCERNLHLTGQMNSRVSCKNERTKP